MKIKDIMLYLPRGLYSTIAKTYRADLDDNIKDKILEEGMYHFVPNEEVANAILESEYLKPASGMGKYINSYGTPVACLFCGKPDIDNFVKNVTDTNTKNNPYINPCMVSTAVKVSPTDKEELKNYKIRNLSDSAVLYEGYCVLPHKKIQVVKMVPDLIRDKNGIPIKDNIGEFKISFREARKEELVEGSNIYLAQKDYLDFIKQKSIEFGYSKNEDKISGKVNNYLNNIIDQARMEKDVTKDNFMQNAGKNLKELINRVTSWLKNIRSPKLEDSVGNIIDEFSFNKKNPYQDKKVGEFIARQQSVKGIEQIDLKTGLMSLKENNINEFIINKYNKLQEDGFKMRKNGEEHSKRVILNSMIISQKENIFTGWDSDNKAKDILITAAAFHDTGRIGNNGPYAKRSARKVGKMNLKFSDGRLYSEEDKKILMAIIEAHDSKKDKIDKMLEKYNIKDENSIYVAKKLTVVLKDAVALDRARFDKNRLGQTKADLNPKFLTTNTAKSMIKASYELENLTNRVSSMEKILTYPNHNLDNKKQQFDESLRVPEGSVDEKRAIQETENAKNNKKQKLNPKDFELTND
ncbi:MAG: hypothetical protein ACI4UE_05640 [Candidatus Scatovivens sp.]